MIRLEKIFNCAEVGSETILIDGQSYEVKKGKHAFWIPELEAKLIWSWNGKIESYSAWHRGRNEEAILNHTFNDDVVGFDRKSLWSIANEYLIFKYLAEANMSPPLGGLFYCKNVISDFLYESRHCDSRGMYGYFIKDATKLPEGEFTFDRFKRKYVDTGTIRASDGALGDMMVESRNNVVNGYLIDIRRTIWDMMAMLRQESFNSIRKGMEYVQSKEELKDKIMSLGQFPYGQRKLNYESYWLSDGYVAGSRDTLYRYDKMGIEDDLSGKTVLDLGCCTGAMCVEAYRRGARQVCGLDHEGNYIDCARDLARANGYQVNFLTMDLTRPGEVIDFVRSYYRKPISMVFALSIYKHILGAMWEILRNLDFEVCYVEGSNAPEGLDTPHAKDMVAVMDSEPSWSVEYLGQTQDRSPRCLWRIR